MRSLIQWALAVPIGILSLANFCVLGGWWYLEFVVFHDRLPVHYPPTALAVGVVIICMLPYSMVKRDDSRRRVAYAISYAFLGIFLCFDLALIAEWLAVK